MYILKQSVSYCASQLSVGRKEHHVEVPVSGLSTMSPAGRSLSAASSTGGVPATSGSRLLLFMESEPHQTWAVSSLTGPPDIVLLVHLGNVTLHLCEVTFPRLCGYIPVCKARVPWERLIPVPSTLVLDPWGLPVVIECFKCLVLVLDTFLLVSVNLIH